MKELGSTAGLSPGCPEFYRKTAERAIGASLDDLEGMLDRAEVTPDGFMPSIAAELRDELETERSTE